MSRNFECEHTSDKLKRKMSLAYTSALRMEAIYSQTCQPTWLHIPEGSSLHNHLHECLIFHESYSHHHHHHHHHHCHHCYHHCCVAAVFTVVVMLEVADAAAVVSVVVVVVLIIVVVL
jgi:hypothetical protein